MAKGGGRKYNRDKNGRFASSGGGGGSKSSGGKAQSTRQKNVATDRRLLDKGMTAVGGRLRNKTAGLYAGAKATQRANADQWVRTGATTAKRKAGTVGAGTRSQLQANAAKVTKDRVRTVSKAASKGTKKMDKAPANATKQEYQALRSQQRRNKRYDWAATKSDSAKAAGVTRKLNSMVKSRGVAKPAKRSRKK